MKLVIEDIGETLGSIALIIALWQMMCWAGLQVMLTVTGYRRRLLSPEEQKWIDDRREAEYTKDHYQN